MIGWVSIHRRITENPIWLSERFTRGQAWIDLILLANRKRGSFYVRDIEIIVERGQLAIGEVALSERWRWSRTKVRGFLQTLKTRQQIIIYKSNIINKIELVNYDLYQEKNNKLDNRKTTEEQQKNINNKDNKDNKKKDNTNVLYKKGRRLSSNWVPNEKNISYAEEQGLLNGEINSVAEDFLDYWLSASGSNAIKMDWDATWRRWIRTHVQNLDKKQEDQPLTREKFERQLAKQKKEARQ